jgi:flagellar basal-body rod protein FlgC
MINAIGIALSGMDAAVKKLNASASNIANMQTAGSLNGTPAPYTPVTAVSTSTGQGVRTDIIPKSDPFSPAYYPDSPFANSEGLVGVPNVDLAEEAVNMMLAETAYKANIATIKTADALQDELFRALNEKA